MIFSYRILIKLINPLIIILLPSIILSGCASHYSNSASELTNLHGVLKKSGNQGVHPVRLIAYLKNPTVFGQSVKVSDLKSILVIDAQFEFKKEGDIPLFRVKLNPQNIPQDTWQQLPSTLNITLRYGRHDQLFMFSTAIAKNKGTGDITSPWTYCDKCVGLVESTQRYANINLYHQLNKFVDSQNLKFYTALLRFEGKPKNPFKTGEELTQAIAANKAKKAQIAKAKAEKAKQERLARLREEEEQRMYGEVRQAYLDFVQTANNTRI